MCVKGQSSLNVVAWGFSTAPGINAENHAETSLLLLRARTGNIPANSGAPIPLDPFPLFESGETIIDGVFRIFLQVVLRGGIRS